MRRAAAPGSPVVIKIGTSSLTGGEPGIEPEAVARVVSNVMTAWEAGHPTVLVTSGAIAAGLPAMGLSDRPGDLPGLQVAAAVGQNRLMAMYTAAFEREGRAL